MRSPLILGSRGSKLALWQANFIKEELERHHRIEVRLESIRTTGDKITDVPLAQVGGTKALFTKEIEDAMLAGRIDLAVHSLKDMPVQLPDGLTLGAIPAREDPRDALVSRNGQQFAALPPGARIGTSSLRRQVQLKLLRKDIQIETLRGNLDTRLRKLSEGQYDAIVVAAAGLKRLGWQERATQFFTPDEMVPAIGQGALALEARADDVELREGLSFLRDPAAEATTRAERAFLARLGGGCQVPIGAHAVVDGDRLRLVGVVVNVEGERAVRGTSEGTAADAARLGESLAEKLLRTGAEEILAAIAAANPPMQGSA
ncbi:MAG: hydroxymethylbilane synthase [Candidatus Acidiferrales bacterium]